MNADGESGEGIFGSRPIMGRTENDNKDKVCQQGDIAQRLALQGNGTHMQAEQQTLGGGFIGIFIW